MRCQIADERSPKFKALEEAPLWLIKRRIDTKIAGWLDQQLAGRRVCAARSGPGVGSTAAYAHLVGRPDRSIPRLRWINRADGLALVTST